MGWGSTRKSKENLVRGGHEPQRKIDLTMIRVREEGVRDREMRRAPVRHRDGTHTNPIMG